MKRVGLFVLFVAALVMTSITIFPVSDSYAYPPQNKRMNIIVCGVDHDQVGFSCSLPGDDCYTSYYCF